MFVINIEGKSVEVENGATLLDALKQSGKNDRSIVALEVDGEALDLRREVKSSFSANIVRTDSDAGLDILRHSAAHIMAQAVKRLYKDVKVAIGPSIENGFYYDFETEHPFTLEDLPKIEKEMKNIIKENINIERKVLSRKDAVDMFVGMGETYKKEIIEGIPGDEDVSIYEQGDFVDLCRGAHVPSTGYLKAYKLLSVAGAYWRGDSNNTMLSRIYGTAFSDRGKLDEHMKILKEAKERDHRKIGKELDLFSFHEDGPGFPFWHANGMIIYRELESYIREQNTNYGYDEISTPPILNEELWHRSGHWNNFKDNMYFTDIDENPFAIKPMNCPGGLLVYKTKLHSYRDLPLRNAELGMVHRHELSGVLHGLFRVRAFTQDDAHIFCTKEQVGSEIISTVEYVLDVYKKFGFDNCDIFIATRPEKSIGSDEDWALATDSLKNALSTLNINYKLKEGEGAFYGPKIEFNIKDVLNRNWQCGTIQVDFSMPSRFELSYEGADGEKHSPVMIHRAILGSLERFIGILIENYNGKFPLWLAPTQVVILTVGGSEKQNEYAKNILVNLKKDGIRATFDERNESMGYKIRFHRLQRIPYMFIIGDDEVDKKSISIRIRDREQNEIASFEEVLDKLKKEIKERANDSIF